MIYLDDKDADVLGAMAKRQDLYETLFERLSDETARKVALAIICEYFVVTGFENYSPEPNVKKVAEAIKNWAKHSKR